MSVIGGQNPIVQDGLVYILDFGNTRSYVSGSNSAKSLIYNPVTASFVAPPAGDYSGLAVAYSVRRVVSNYSGPAMEVQSGSVSASIGFDSFGNLDTSSLLAFAGSGDAFVKTWYDQSGKNNHAITLSTGAQPRIVYTGSMELLNGQPTLYYDNTNSFRLTTTIEPGQQLAIIGVSKVLTNPASTYTSRLVEKQALFALFDAQTSNNYYPQFFIKSGGTTYAVDYTDNRENKTSLLYGWATGTSVNIAVNSQTGSALSYSGNIDTSTRQTHIGAYLGSYAAKRYNSEILIYTSSNEGNRTFIENNINSYYNIYTGSNEGPVPTFTPSKLEINSPTTLSTNQSFPGFSYDQGNLTLIFTGEIKTNTPLFTQANQISVVGTTSSIGYGLPTNNLGRTFPASGFDHISLRFTTGSVDCFVNGIPTAPNSIFPTGSFGTDDFIASNYSGSLGNLMIYNRPLTDDEIYSIYLQQARRYGLPEQAKPYSVDSSVYVYTQAAGISDSVTLNALNTFVLGLKSASLWDKMIAIYPFIGTTASGSRLNLKDVSLNTTQVNYSGSWSTSLSGSRNNNTSSYGILSNIRGTYVHPLINSQSIHLSYLSYDTPTSGGYLMGVEQIPGLPGDIAQPAAAYSVRKVRTAYTGSAMTVRRDFDDVTFDVGFDGNGNLNTGSLITNMTASGLTTTLPGDYSGLAAAYSLRKVSSSYSGYAIEVRRASDNFSGSIGFDASGNLNTASLASFIRTGSETPIDAYSGLAVAYSLRKVVPSYAGFAIEVQSGSVSQSIGFDSFGDLDVTAIKSFAGSGDAFVKTWYDQSGNNNHATQSSAAVQPQILSSGSIITDGVKTALRWNDSGTTNLSFFRLTNIGSVFYIARLTNIGIREGFFLGDSINYDYHSGWLSGPTWLGTDTKAAILNGQNRINGVDRSFGSTTRDLNRNLISMIHQSSTGVASTISNDRGITGRSWRGFINEILIYTSSQSSNRTYIENNINSYYGIYTPDSVSTENAFVKTWYDQSGNNRHATQVSESRQPQIVENGTIILDQSRPSLKWNNGIFLNNTSSYTLNSVAWAARSTDGAGFSTIVTTGTTLGITPGVYSNNTIRTENGLYRIVGNNADTNDLVFDSGSMFFNGKTTTTSNNIQTGHVGFLRVDSTKTSAARTQIGIHYGDDRAWKGYISELVLYSTNLTASRGLIEDNINGYYNIFTQSLASGSGYVTRWYDQSSNNNHATQSVAANQPLIVSSGSIVTLYGKPSLQFNGTSRFDLISSPLSFSNNSTHYFVHTSTGGTIFGTSGYRYGRFDGPTTIVFGSGTGKTVTTSQNVREGLITFTQTSATNGIRVHKNSVDVTTTAAGTSGGDMNKIGYTSIGPDIYLGNISEIVSTASYVDPGNRAPIEQNINSYFNIYTPVGYNFNNSSLSLFSSPTVVAGAANAPAGAITTGGPLGLITVSRTATSSYTLWKNRVPTIVTGTPVTASSSELYLNAANLNNASFSGSQNNIAYASVGAGLTDNELYTYYELVDNLQSSLNKRVADPTAFISVWDTTKTGTGVVSNTSSIILPFVGTPAVTASWGDGTVSFISASNQLAVTHSYAVPGIYTVTVSGSHAGFRFGTSGDRAKIIDITQWGGNAINGGLSAYQGCFNLVGTAADAPSLASLDQYGLQWAFQNATSFKGYVNHWDTKNLQSLSQTFRGASSFNSPLDRWDVSRLTAFNLAFNASAFNQPIGNWRFSTSSNVSFSSMFSSSPFNQNIGAWNVEKVTAMDSMHANTPFNNSGSADINNWRPISCSNFRSMFSSTPFNQPIGNWAISASGISMASMFQQASAFNQNIGSWDVSRVTGVSTTEGFYRMFYDAVAFNNSGSNTINNWRFTTSSDVTMQEMFYNADAFNQNIGAWNVEKVTNMSGMFAGTALFNNSGSNSINNWRPISCSNFSSMFNLAAAFNQPIGNWPLSASNIDMGNMFRNSNFSQDIGSWDVSRVISFGSMFQQSGFNNSGSTNINNWQINTGSNVSFFQMFYQCTFNQPIGSWNVSKVTTMYSMFENNSAFNQSLENWTPISCSNFSRMFYNRTGFNGSVLNWTLPTNTAFTTDLMFSGGNTTSACKLDQDLSNWNVTKATNMSGMFGFNTSFNNSGSAGINSWTPVSCSNFSNMFLSASAFNQPVEGWTLPTDRTFNMSNMFARATSFNQPLGNWTILSCSNMSGMLDNCGMDKGFYSSTLIGWAMQAPNIPIGITLGAAGRQYDTPGSSSRSILTSAPYNWVITGDTYVP